MTRIIDFYSGIEGDDQGRMLFIGGYNVYY